jgi:hypothetical protein
MLRLYRDAGFVLTKEAERAGIIKWRGRNAKTGASVSIVHLAGISTPQACKGLERVEVIEFFS